MGTDVMNFITMWGAWRMLAFLGTILCGILALSTIAKAEPKVRKSIGYYTIHGKSALELDFALARGGPRISNMSRHPGAAQIKFAQNVGYRTSHGRCEVASAGVSLSLNITLPRWAERGGANGNLAILWDALSGDIKRHEEQHGTIAIQHARQMEAALKNLPSQDSCDHMKAVVARSVDQQLSLHAADQVSFDRNELANFESRMRQLVQRRTMEATASR
jgi:predicted secreted Zn-dependent protease